VKTMVPPDPTFTYYFILLLAAPIIVLALAGSFCIKHPRFRTKIGASLVAVGVMEVIPFLALVGPNYYIPFNQLIWPLSYVFIEGIITIIAGVTVLRLSVTRPSIVHKSTKQKLN
jgi:hypothetical protein